MPTSLLTQEQQNLIWHSIEQYLTKKETTQNKQLTTNTKAISLMIETEVSRGEATLRQTNLFSAYNS